MDFLKISQHIDKLSRHWQLQQQFSDSFWHFHILLNTFYFCFSKHTAECFDPTFKICSVFDHPFLAHATGLTRLPVELLKSKASRPIPCLRLASGVPSKVLAQSFCLPFPPPFPVCPLGPFPLLYVELHQVFLGQTECTPFWRPLALEVNSLYLFCPGKAIRIPSLSLLHINHNIPLSPGGEGLGRNGSFLYSCSVSFKSQFYMQIFCPAIEVLR